MKKINFKAVLMLLLAFILVFALVACDKPEPEEPPTPPTPPTSYTPAEYFTTLWDLTSGIGNESIAESDDIALHADLAIELALQDFDGVKTQNISVGLGLDVVLDRTSADSHNTALKLNAYDPDNGENWFAGYFFFNDPSNLYLDIAGSNVKLPFDYKNDTYAGSLHNLIFDKVIIGEGTANELKVNDIINLVTKGMGTNWSLDNLIDGVLKMTGLDLKAMIEQDPTIGGFIESLIPLDQLFDADGGIKIKEVLTSEIASTLFANTKKAISGDKTTYSTQLNTTFLSRLVPIIPVEGLNSLITGATQIKLEFAQKGQEFDHFTLSMDIPSKKATDAAGNKSVFPIVSLTINSLEFRKATAEGNNLGINRTNYSSEVVFEEEIELDVDGLMLNPKAFDQNIAMEPITLSNVKLAVGIKGKVDLKNKEDNGTFANAWIRLGDKHFVDLSYKDNALGLKVDQTVKFGNVSVMDTIATACGEQLFNAIHGLFEKNGWNAEGFDRFANEFFAKEADGTTVNYGALNPNFKGAVWYNVDMLGGFQGLVDQVIKMITTKPAPGPTPEPGPEGGKSAAEEPSIIEKVLDTVQKAISLFDTTGNKLTIKSNDVFAKVVEIGKIYNSQFTVDTVIDAVIAKDASKMLQQFAKFFQIEGLEQGEMTDEEFARAFLNTIFDDLKGELTLDLSDDSYELSVAIVANGNVKVNVSSVLTTTEFNSAEFVDIAAEYENATDKAGWLDFYMSVQEQPAA